MSRLALRKLYDSLEQLQRSWVDLEIIHCQLDEDGQCELSGIREGFDAGIQGVVRAVKMLEKRPE